MSAAFGLASPLAAISSLSRRRGSLRAQNGYSRISAQSEKQQDLTGVVFESMGGKEAQNELATVRKTNEVSESLGRVDFKPSCEAAINEQINIEYNISYIYHSLYSFFDRDNVGLPGFAKFFKDSSVEEREHAEQLMDYQNVRGGRVKLLPITAPATEFNDAEKGEALHAMEMALALEKLNLQKLTHLHQVAEEAGDAQMQDFVDEMLSEQVDAVNKVAKYVSQLRRVGKGLGVYQFDKELQ